MTESPLKPIFKKARKGFQGYPLATFAFYGPDDFYATKVAVGIILQEGAEPLALERWKVEGGDIRMNVAVGKQLAEFIRVHAVRSVAATARIMGCPHEEGTDYPEGGVCRRCPYWIGRDRFSGEHR